MLTERKKILYVVEAMGGGVFTYIVDLANALVDTYDMYIAYAVRKQTPKNYRDYFDKRIKLVEVKNFCREIKPTKELAAVEIQSMFRVMLEIHLTMRNKNYKKAGWSALVGHLAKFKA